MFHMFFRSLRYYVAFMSYGKYMSLSIADKKCWNVKSGGSEYHHNQIFSLNPHLFYTQF